MAVIITQTLLLLFPKNRFLTTDRVSWCLTTIGEIVKRLLVAFTRIVNRGRNVGHILDVQIRQGDARAAAHAEVSHRYLIARKLCGTTSSLSVCSC